jgi:hypothetical protein
VCVVTGDDGRATWCPERPLPDVPVVTALAEGDGLLLAVLEAAGPRQVVVRVWSLVPRRALAGAGVRVHLTAVAGTG